MPDNLGFVVAAYAVVLLSVLGYGWSLRSRRARLQAELREPRTELREPGDERTRSGAADGARGAVTTD